MLNQDFLKFVCNFCQVCQREGTTYVPSFARHRRHMYICMYHCLPQLTITLWSMAPMLAFAPVMPTCQVGRWAESCPYCILLLYFRIFKKRLQYRKRLDIVQYKYVPPYIICFCNSQNNKNASLPSNCEIFDMRKHDLSRIVSSLWYLLGVANQLEDIPS